MATASKDDLALLPGFGPLKVFDFTLTVVGFQNIKKKFNFRRTKLFICGKTNGKTNYLG